MVGTTVYLPCLSGPVAIRVTTSPPRLHQRWSSDVGGGPPIIAAGLVWTIAQDGTLYGLDPSTGAVRQRASIGAPANHFPTPSVGDGLLLAASANRVVAFRAAAAKAAATAQSDATTATAPAAGVAAGNPAKVATPQSSQGLPAGAVTGIVAGAVLLLGAAGLLWRHKRTSVAP